jgi:serine/threonine protein kinase
MTDLHAQVNENLVWSATDPESFLIPQDRIGKGYLLRSVAGLTSLTRYRRAYATVYKALHKDANVAVALKVAVGLPRGKFEKRQTEDRKNICKLKAARINAAQVMDFSRASIDEKLKEEIMREVDILRSLSHPNIVSYFGCYFIRNELWVRSSA